jgi:hypothetical protein
MQNQEKEYYSLGELTRNVRLFTRFVLRKWYLLLLALMVGAVIGFWLFSIQKPKYEAECTFILEEKQGGMGGSLSGIASQFGVDLGGMSGGGMFAGDNILEILTSKVILSNVLLSHVDSSANANTLADLFMDFKGLKSRWQKDALLSQVNFKNIHSISEMNVKQDSVLNIIYTAVIKDHLLVERISKKGSIMSVRVLAENPLFSKLLVQRLVVQSRLYYVTVKTSVTSANVLRLQKKADSLLYLLTNKTYQVANVQVNDLNPALRSLQVPTEIATRDKSILSGLYSEVIKNLEIAKTTLMLQTPVIEILDVPSLSIYDNKKGKLFFIVIGAFIAAVITTVILLFRFFSRSVIK